MATRPKASRGRLSTIDTLPEWADEAKLLAFTALKERKLSQLEIFDAFNIDLRAAAIANGVSDPPVISRSAFNRASLRVSLLGRRLEETRELAAILAPTLDEAGDSSLTLLVAESIKTMISEMLSNAGELDANSKTAEMLLNLARALHSAENSKRISTETRKKYEAELAAKANKAIDAVAKSRGLTKDTVEDIKAQILGIEKK